ncbi:MAG: CHASE domain-containing protein [Pseudomonadota bacterium]
MRHAESTASRPVVDILHNRYTAWVVLLISIAITIVAWKLSSDSAEQRTRERFKFQVDEAQFAIDKRMTDYVQVLRGGLALFESAKSVDRTMWHRYVETLALNESYPGIQGIGFSLWIDPKDKASVEQRVRAEGFPNFSIKPEGERTVYSSIIYLEPFDTRNQRAFGFDMYSEKTRREAMERARDTGEPAMSGKVKLMQETITDIQPGFLIYLPLYSKPVTIVEERRENLRGFVYSPFRVRDLMMGILGYGSPEVDFEIYDSDTLDPETLLYDSEGHTTGEHEHEGTLQEIRKLTIAGHSWTISYTSTPALMSATATNQPLFVAFAGVAIDLLLFYIILALSHLRQRADRLAEERMNVLREREQHFKIIADTANDGIITCNHAGEISYCNRAAGKIFGYSAQQMLDIPLARLFSPEKYREVIIGALERSALAEGASATASTAPIEIDGYHLNGSIIPLELSVSSWSVGERRYATAIMRDVSERKRIDRMKTEFISTVSHELRTPLTAIRGSLGLVAGGLVGDINEKARGLLETATRNSERLSRLINDILDMEKMESGEMRFKLQSHSTGKLLQDAVEHNNAVASEAGISLAISECDDVLVRIDNDRFQQVLTNLIANAIKFSPAGGNVTLSCRNRGTVVRIAVQDQGPGIPEDFRSRIFQKFAQADSSDSRQKGGTGLGLSIVKAIVERFGGSVGFESAAGGGTLFYCDLPIAEIKSVAPINR